MPEQWLALNLEEGWVKVKDYRETWCAYRRGGPYTDGPKPAILDVMLDGRALAVTENNLRQIPEKIIVCHRVVEAVEKRRLDRGEGHGLMTPRFDEYLLEG